MSMPPRMLEERSNALEVTLLEAALDEPPPKDLLARTLVTVGVCAGLTAASATAQAATAAATTQMAALTGLSLAKWLGVGLLGGFLIAGGIEVSGVAPPLAAAPRAGVERAARSEVAKVRRGEPAQASEPAPETAPSTAPEVPPVRSSAPSAQAGGSASDLLAEVALLDAARQALRGGDARRALALLDQHAREFPAGRLRPEAEVTRIEAVAQTDPRAASAMARAFLARHPDSPHAERVGAIVRDDRPLP